ncbi:MAG: methyltransferase domain-containing protein [Patescibacteria group bacterium]
MKKSRLNFLLEHVSPGKILDVGNLDKNGQIHSLLLKKMTGSEIYGLDILDQREFGLNFPNQKIGSFEDLGYPDNFFDVIYAGEIIEHTWKPKQTMDGFYRVLKQGGILILDTPNVYSLSRILRYLCKGEDVVLGNPEHTMFFSRAMIENLLGSAGFKIETLTTERFTTMKGKSIPLPGISPFGFMGECLLVSAEK